MNTVENTVSALLNDADIAAINAEIASIDAPTAETIKAAAAENAPIVKKATNAGKKKAKAPAVVEQAVVVEAQAEVVDHVPGVMKEMIAAVTPKQATKKQKEIEGELDTRIAFENAQPGLSSKMIPNLEAAKKRMTQIGVASIFCAINLDPEFVNREISAGSKFNVYGLQKVNDLVTGIGSGILQNAINRAVLMSMFNFKKANIAFTGEAALAAVSDKIKIDKAVVKHLVRHTVSQSTASTQKSSTMNALEVLGIVSSNKLRGNAEVYTLTDTPQTRKLEAVLMAA